MKFDMTLATEWLRWSPRSAEDLTALSTSYESLVAEAFGAAFANALRSDPQAKAIIERWDAINDAAMQRILSAPSTSFACFYQRNAPTRFLDHLVRCLDAENWRDQAMRVTTSAPLLSASGDIFTLPYGPTTGPFPIRQTPLLTIGTAAIPVDFRSRHALAISLGDDHPQLSDAELDELLRTRAIDLYSDADEVKHLNRIEHILNGIGDRAPHVAWFVAFFTKALVIRNNRSEPTRFTSGSSGQFVGRTCLVNVSAAFVDDAIVADALVHEAIHSMLYMMERHVAWVDDLDVFEGNGHSAISPWTGAMLTPRQFMQACFVWFGLYQFWTITEVQAWFGQAAHRQAAIAREGFYKSSLIDMVSWRSTCAPDLLDAIEILQRRLMTDDFPEFA